MGRVTTEKSVIALYRQCVLSGSERDIDLQAPLGKLGLDSLAIVQFLTALENTFKVELADDIWSGERQYSVSELIDVIVESSDQTDDAPVEAVVPSRQEDRSAKARIHRNIQRHGVWGGIARMVTHRVNKIIEPYHRRQQHHILFADLSKAELSRPDARVELRFGALAKTDLGSLNGFWETEQQESIARRIRYLLDEGHIGMVAWHGDTIVAMDFLAVKEYHDRDKDLVFDPADGVCFGFDLSEHRKFKGKGVGLSLLAYVLEEARRRGWYRHYTVVNAKNEKMLAASSQIFGFRKVGHSKTTAWFSRSRSSWWLGDTNGHGGKIRLE